MNEPLFWNPLPAAAAWLSKRTGHDFDALVLVDTVAQVGKAGTPESTIIKAMLPSELQFAALTSHAYLDPTETAPERVLRDFMAKRFGPLPTGLAYVEAAYPKVAPLCVNDLLAMLMHGYLDIKVLRKMSMPNQFVWLMPWGTSHRATVETCGINRADLLALGETLASQFTPDKSQSTPAPVGAVGASLTHSTRARRNTLTPVIELAQAQCRNPKDTAEVWAALQVLAQKKHPPLIGGTEDGLQYYEAGEAAIFKRKSLGKRLAR